MTDDDEWELIGEGPSLSGALDDEWELIGEGPSIEDSPSGGFWPGAWQGIKDIPSALYNMPGQVLGLAGDIGGSVISPAESLHSGQMERAARGTGGLAAALAGAGTGATFGSALGPVGTALGGAAGLGAGLLGFDWLNQLTGSDAPTTPNEDAQRLGYNMSQGLGTAGLLKGAGLAAKGTGKVLAAPVRTFKDTSKALLERALGVQYGDRLKGLNRVALYLDDQGNPVPLDALDDAVTVEAPLQQQVQFLKDKGFFRNIGDSADDIKIAIGETKGEVGKVIGDLSSEAERVLKGKEILPDFETSQKYINSFRDTTKGQLKVAFDEIVNDYINHPGDGFSKLADFTDKLQKETKFDTSKPPETTRLKRQIAYDLRQASESAFNDALPKRAGQFAEANKTYAALSTIGQTLNKRLAKGEPSLTSYLKGGSLPAAIGTGAASALTPLSTTQAMGVSGVTLLADALRRGLEAKYPVTASSLYESLSKNLPVRAAGGVGAGLESLGSMLKASARPAAAFLGADSRIPSEIESSELLNERLQGVSVSPGSSQERQKGDSRLSKAPVKSSPTPLQEPKAKSGQARGIIPPFQNSTTTRRSLIERALDEAEKKLLEGEARKAKERISMDTKSPKDFDRLVKAVIHQESGGKATAVSSKGARGLMQIMPETAKEIAKELGVKTYDLNDPATNQKFGEHYLKKMLKMFGDKELALAAYNLGPGALKKLMKESGLSSWSDLSKYLERKKKYLETVNYVPSVLKKEKFLRT